MFAEEPQGAEYPNKLIILKIIHLSKMASVFLCYFYEKRRTLENESKKPILYFGKTP